MVPSANINPKICAFSGVFISSKNDSSMLYFEEKQFFRVKLNPNRLSILLTVETAILNFVDMFFAVVFGFFLTNSAI
jgi:hypothetical protein